MKKHGGWIFPPSSVEQQAKWYDNTMKSKSKNRIEKIYFCEQSMMKQIQWYKIQSKDTFKSWKNPQIL